MASNIDNPDHVDPNFPTSIEEVEERLKVGDAMTCEEAAAPDFRDLIKKGK